MYAIKSDSIRSGKRVLEVGGGIVINTPSLLYSSYQTNATLGEKTFGLYYGYKRGKNFEIGVLVQYLEYYADYIYGGHFSNQWNITERIFKIYVPFYFNHNFGQHFNIGVGPFLAVTPLILVTNSYTYCSVSNNVLTCNTGHVENSPTALARFDIGGMLRAQYLVHLSKGLLSFGFKAQYGLGVNFEADYRIADCTLQLTTGLIF